jgi:trk system potassium uptake protein TrkH
MRPPAAGRFDAAAMNGVLIFLSVILATFAASLIPPMLVSATLSEGFASDYAVISGLVLFFAGGIYLALHGRPLVIGRVASYALLLLAWILLPIIGSLPFLVITDMAPVDALFEAVSGLTTTGASVVESVDALPRSLVLWRSETQWLGGFLALLSILLVIAPAGVGGLPESHIKLIEHGGRGSDIRIAQMIGGIAFIYCTASLACLILLVIGGTPLLDAVCLAFSTVSTGGFMPRDATLSAYNNHAVNLTLSVFMIVGATSVLWQRMLLQRRTQLLSSHRESYFVIVGAIIAGVIMAIVTAIPTAGDAPPPLLDSLVSGLTSGISLVTTTGFETDLSPLSLLPLTLVSFIAFIGAGTFSTAGGIKMYRFGGMLVQSSRDLRRLVYPHGIRAAHFGSQPYDIQFMKAIWSAFFAAIIVVLTGTVILAADQPHFEGAWLAAVSAFSNIGPLYNPDWAREGTSWPDYARFANGSKYTLMGLMLLGRIEILAVFGLLNRYYWTRR